MWAAVAALVPRMAASALRVERIASALPLTDGAETLIRILRRLGYKTAVISGGFSIAAEALKVFNERNIDDLIVVNSKCRPVGLVDSQDLPKLKLM